jgi:protein-S-isoprenylcysteine O-methyltransferase Ste14
MEFARHRRSACAARNIGTVSVYSPPELLRSLLEIACVPLIRGLVITAAAFSGANMILLAYRIRLEERALGDRYQRAFAERARSVPGISG